MHKALTLGATLAVLTGAWLLVPGCGGEAAEVPIGGGPGGRDAGSSGGTRPSNSDELPLGLLACLNPCHNDEECMDCGQGRRVCDSTSKTCVACGSRAGGRSCGQGETCNESTGLCHDSNLACDVDGSGLPTVECAADADCAACGEGFTVCNGDTKRCGSCDPARDQMGEGHCKGNQACVTNDANQVGNCVDKCPDACTSDAQCGQCGDAGGPGAHFCTQGRCAACDPTREDATGCEEGRQCLDNGTCETKCGDNNGAVERECASDADCDGCSGMVNQDNGAGSTIEGEALGAGSAGDVEAAKWQCKKAIGSSKGQCAPLLNGDSACAQLGAQILPKPFSQFTAVCADDGECSGAGAQFNVGGLLSQATGLPGISDGLIAYGMPICAKVEVMGRETPCGVCVPCREDADCKDIDIMQTVGGVFGPVGGLLSGVLSSTIFGDDPPIIYMTCAKVFGNFGACVPCSSITTACGDKKKEEEEPEPEKFGCNGRDAGWYCSGLDRRTAYYCDGDKPSGSAYFCPSDKGNCHVQDSETSPLAKSKAADPDDGQAQNGQVPDCQSTPDPLWNERAEGNNGGSSSGGGASSGAMGVRPL